MNSKEEKLHSIHFFHFVCQSKKLQVSILKLNSSSFELKQIEAYMFQNYVLGRLKL